MADDKIAAGRHLELAEVSTMEAQHTKDAMSIAEKAHLATQDEHSMTVWQAVKRYRKACLWSMAFSLSIIMDGYDTAILGSLPAFPAFRYRFGHQVDDTTSYQLDPSWQVAIGLSNPLGNLIGVYINSFITEKFGHKNALLGTLVYLVGVIFITFFAQNIEMFFAGSLLNGLAWGVFTTMAPAYASEVCPVVLRSYLETWVVMCWGIGQFVSFGMLKAFSHEQTDYWAWRIPIAVQWAWPTIIFPLVLFAPESPWWLVRKGRIEDAEKSMTRLSTADRQGAKQAVALMIQTNDLEKAMGEEIGMMECFRGTNLWRTEIACVAWTIQQLSGFVVSGYGTYFFQQAGLKTSESFSMSVGQAGIHFVCNLIGLPVNGRYGRRSVFLWGVVGMSTAWFIIGFIALAPANVAQGYAESAIYLLWYCIYQITVGPGAYIIVSEASTTRLRSHTISLARNCYNIASILNSVVGPYILNPTAGNWKGKCGFLTGGILVFCFIWAFFRLPEMRGRTYEELDILFSMDLSAREFKKQPVNIQAEDTKHEIVDE
ncbi:Sugar/inositol transporter [Pleurostoma richardsiae]|uniref:Sugar/inositol transporter n=1 Tax=Pleurostoma richardsiae TaxID=41990 RepID=A0AA38VY41_9PEZI|nr:Sugar/inositol transporter [Pleurostoma richardsiae]